MDDEERMKVELGGAMKMKEGATREKREERRREEW